MPIFKSLLVLLLLLLTTKSRAQTSEKPAPPVPESREMVVNVTLPTVIATISDYAGVLFSSEKGKLKSLSEKRQSRTSNPVLVFTLPIPKGWGDKKAKSEK